MFSMPKQHVPRKLYLFKVVYERNKKEEKGNKSESNVLDYYKISTAYSRYVLLTLRATQGLHIIVPEVLSSSFFCNKKAVTSNHAT